MELCPGVPAPPAKLFFLRLQKKTLGFSCLLARFYCLPFTHTAAKDRKQERGREGAAGGSLCRTRGGAGRKLQFSRKASAPVCSGRAADEGDKMFSQTTPRQVSGHPGGSCFDKHPLGVPAEEAVPSKLRTGPGSCPTEAAVALTTRTGIFTPWAANPHVREPPLPEPTGEEAAEQERRESPPKHGSGSDFILKLLVQEENLLLV